MRKLLAIVVVGITILLPGCFGTISEGNVGVRTTWSNKVNMQEENPGFYVAVFDSVKEYIGKEIEVKFENLTPKAKDNLSLHELDVSIFYNFNTSETAEFVVKHSNMSVAVGDTKLISPGYGLFTSLGKGVINDVISKFESLTIHTKRDDIERAIQAQLQADLDRKVPGYFTINNIVIRQATTDPALEASIRSAVQMQKQVEAKVNEKELAIAEAERKLAEANGITAYNNAITKSITPELLEFKRIEMMQKFAGEGTHTVIMPSDSKTILNLK